MTHAAYYDEPAHPLGLVTHPNWAAVRARYDELRCAAILSGAYDFRDQQKGGASVPSFGSADHVG